MKQFNWLLEKYEPKEITVHTNRKECTPEEFDEKLLASYGYKENDTIIYKFKQGHSTLLSNPYMDGK